MGNKLSKQLIKRGFGEQAFKTAHRKGILGNKLAKENMSSSTYRMDQVVEYTEPEQFYLTMLLTHPSGEKMEHRLPE